MSELPPRPRRSLGLGPANQCSLGEGQPERLLELFHDRMAIVGTSGNRYGVGRLACVESYRNFIASPDHTLRKSILRSICTKRLRS